MTSLKVLVPAVMVLAGAAAAIAPLWAADAAAGATLFATKCQTCHGKSGEGNPGIAKALKVEMKALSSAEVQGKSDAELKKNFTEGNGKMKAVAGLSAADADNLVAHLRSMKK